MKFVNYCSNRLAYFLVIIGALNWLSIGVLQFDVIAAVFGGPASLFARIVYLLIGLAGLWLIIFRGPGYNFMRKYSC